MTEIYREFENEILEDETMMTLLLEVLRSCAKTQTEIFENESFTYRSHCYDFSELQALLQCLSFFTMNKKERDHFFEKGMQDLTLKYQKTAEEIYCLNQKVKAHHALAMIQRHLKAVLDESRYSVGQLMPEKYNNDSSTDFWISCRESESDLDRTRIRQFPFARLFISVTDENKFCISYAGKSFRKIFFDKYEEYFGFKQTICYSLDEFEEKLPEIIEKLLEFEKITKLNQEFEKSLKDGTWIQK